MNDDTYAKYDDEELRGENFYMAYFKNINTSTHPVSIMRLIVERVENDSKISKRLHGDKYRVWACFYYYDARFPEHTQEPNTWRSVRPNYADDSYAIWYIYEDKIIHKEPRERLEDYVSPIVGLMASAMARGKALLENN